MPASSMDPDRILVSRSPGETRAALLGGDEVVELAYVRDSEIQPGSVYLGRIRAPVPGIDAVFVDIGAKDPGVLPLKPPFPSEGTAQVVRVVVPPRADKGCVLRAESDKRAAGDAKPPALVRSGPHPAQIWWERYSESIKHIQCEPLTEATCLKSTLSEDAPVEQTAPGGNLFDEFGVEEVIEAALDLVVPLPSGGSLRIESTAAVTAIDIDSGASPPHVANGEAITAIARELRRRNIAGHIVIDVIPAKGNGALPRLLSKAMASDPVSPQVAGVTPLGMIELTRQRRGLSLAEVLLDGQGQISARSVGLKALRGVVLEVAANRASSIVITTSPDVYTCLTDDLPGALAEARTLTKCDIKIEAHSDFARSRVEIRTA